MDFGFRRGETAGLRRLLAARLEAERKEGAKSRRSL
jgi:hypothetical protein